MQNLLQVVLSQPSNTPLKLRILSFTISSYLIFLLRLISETRVWAHNLLWGLCICKYCENESVLDSNQLRLLASLWCFPFTPTALKLSNLVICYNPFSRSLFLVHLDFIFLAKCTMNM